MEIPDTMPQNAATPAIPEPRRTEYLRGLIVLLVIAAVGLFIVKWNPYYHRAQIISVTHSMGRNMLFIKELTTPSPSISAALGYAGSYFKSVWQAWVLGLLLAATIETLLPRNWLARMLGKASARTSLLGGVLALPGMM